MSATPFTSCCSGNAAYQSALSSTKSVLNVPPALLKSFIPGLPVIFKLCTIVFDNVGKLLVSVFHVLIVTTALPNNNCASYLGLCTFTPSWLPINWPTGHTYKQPGLFMPLEYDSWATSLDRLLLNTGFLSTCSANLSASPSFCFRLKENVLLRTAWAKH